MVKSNATTVEAYLDELPADRKRVLSAVRKVILANLPDGYREMMAWGGIAYCIPLERYPKTYNGQPLTYAALASQKGYMSLYMMAAYMRPEAKAFLQEQFRLAGSKLDMGKSCIRFRSLDDLPLEAIGSLIAGTTPERYIAIYEASRDASSRGSVDPCSTDGAPRRERRRQRS